MTELAALNVRITGDSGDLTAAVNSAKTQLGGLNTTIAQTQAKAAGMGGALGGLATRFSGARGQIQNVAFQLQDMAVQLGSGTAASVVFAQQGSQIASAFGPVGAVVGALAAVGIPLLALAFSGASAEAEALSKAAEDQAKSLHALTQATYNLRLERQMLSSGAEFTEEQEQLNRIVELTQKRADIQERLNQLSSIGSRAAGFAEQEKAKRAVLQAELDTIDATLQGLNMERAKTAAVKLGKAAQDEVAIIMRQLSNMDISSPWQKVIGWIKQATIDAQTFGSAASYAAELAQTGQMSGPDVARTQTQFGGAIKLSPTGAGMAYVPPAGGGGGGAAANQLQTELQTLQESLMTQEQLQMESYTRQQETLQQALDARLLSQKDYANLMQQVEATHQAKMGSQMREGVATTIGALSQLFNKSKPLAIASALVNTWQGMTEALKLPFPKNIAAAATTLATGMNAVRNIKSTSPGGGGSTSGSIGAGGAGGAAAAAPQQNVQTLNFTLTNDSFGIGQNLVRQIAAQLNEAQRNGSTLVRATVS